MAAFLANARTRRLLIFSVSAVLVFTFLFHASDTTYGERVKSKLPLWQTWSSQPTKLEDIKLDPRCAELPGAKDMLLVMKTGSSVIDKRLPIHLSTTFRCTPDFLVFSDMAQDFHGLQIHDSLDELHKYVDMSNPDLKYYEYLRKSGETARRKKAQSSAWRFGGWSNGKNEEKEKPDLDMEESSAAWEMDKYKNIPILRKSYAMYPEKKWFLFVDADTSIMWSNILTWVAMLDHTKPFYTGSQNWIGDVEFAHGGSGYIVSQAAARILANEPEEAAKKHISFAEHECCGDMVLSHAFHENSIALNGSWPNIQGSRPDTLDYDENKWCHAAMTFHHTTPEQVNALWNLEKESGEKNITYSDIYFNIVQPAIPKSGILEEWDNGSEHELYPPHRPEEDFEKDPENTWRPRTNLEQQAVASYEGCQALCRAEQHCFQWVYRPGRTSDGQLVGAFNGQCGLRMASFVLGEAVKEEFEEDEAGQKKSKGKIVSGWEPERFEMWAQKHRCDEAFFLTEWGDDGNLEPPRG